MRRSMRSPGFIDDDASYRNLFAEHKERLPFFGN